MEDEGPRFFQSCRAHPTFLSGVTSITWTTVGQSGRLTPPTQLQVTVFPLASRGPFRADDASALSALSEARLQTNHLIEPNAWPVTPRSALLLFSKPSPKAPFLSSS